VNTIAFRYPDVCPVHLEPEHPEPPAPLVASAQADGDPGAEYPIQDSPAGLAVYTLD